jgi:hypothetical protein
MIETLESRVGELAVHGAASALLGVVVLAFLRLVEVSIRRSAVVEWLVLIDAKVPIMVLRLIGAGCCFVPVHIEEGGIYVLQVDLQSLLEGFVLEISFDFMEVEDHCCQIR